MKVAIVKISYDVRVVMPIEDLSTLLDKLAKYPQVKHTYDGDKYVYSYVNGEDIVVEIVDRDEILDPDELVSPKTPF